MGFAKRQLWWLPVFAFLHLNFTGFFAASLGTQGEYSVGGSGVLPVVFLLAGTTVSLVAVSLVTAPPRPETLERFFPARME